MKNKTMKILRLALIILMILTVSFTFYQSSKSKQKSKETSDKVGQIIEPILPSDTPIGGYVQDNIRKIAHFVEFFALGAEVAIYVLLFMPKLKWMLHSVAIAPVVAMLDETIQIFSDRGSAVLDVWIDVLGYCAAAILIYGTYLLYKVVVKKKKDGCYGD